MKNLFIEGKLVIFYTLAISKMGHLGCSYISNNSNVQETLLKQKQYGFMLAVWIIKMLFSKFWYPL